MAGADEALADAPPTRAAWVTLGALSVHNALMGAGCHPPLSQYEPTSYCVVEAEDRGAEPSPPEGAAWSPSPCDWCVRMWTDACEAASAATMRPNLDAEHPVVRL